MEVDADEVANMIATGDTVCTVFIVPGGTVLGPNMKRVIFDNRVEGIEMAAVVEARSFQDLVQL